MYGKGKKEKSAKGNKGMLSGLTNKSPPGCDSSMSTKHMASMDEGATRKGVAPTPRTLGPRTA